MSKRLRESHAMTAAIASLERMATLLPIVAAYRTGRLGEADTLQRMLDAGALEAEARAILDEPRLVLDDRVH